MRLSCQKAFLLAVALIMACHASTAPPRTISGVYRLESVNSQPAPAVVNAGQSDTTTILWATLTLDAAGNAFIAQRWRYVYPPNHTDESTITSQQEYRIIGDSITVGYFKPCPPNAQFVANLAGKLTG